MCHGHSRHWTRTMTTSRRPADCTRCVTRLSLMKTATPPGTMLASLCCCCCFTGLTTISLDAKCPTMPSIFIRDSCVCWMCVSVTTRQSGEFTATSCFNAGSCAVSVFLMLIAMAWKIVGECAPDALRHLQVAGRSRSDGALSVCYDDAD